MATLLLSANNELLYTVKTVIMQRSNLVDELNILVPKYYNSIDMSKFYLYMHYVTPISREHNVIALSLSNENYTGTANDSDKILSYKLPITKELTTESGKLEVWITFYKAEATLDENDELVLQEPYRISYNCYIPITKASDYDNIMLSTVRGAYDAQITALRTSINELKKSVPADLKLDADEDDLYLINHDAEKIGEGIDTADLSNEVGEHITQDDERIDGNEDGIIDLSVVYNGEED